MTAFGYPVFLELAGRRCVVIGRDAVRERKVQGLVAAGADDVLVLAPGAGAALQALAGLDGVRVEPRRWEPDDLDGAFLVVAGSRDPDERDAVAREARPRGALVNVIDDVPNCDWAAPALVRRGELVLAIGTGGASPVLARKLREELEARFGPEWAEVLEILRRVREQTLPSLPSFAERARRWHEVLDPAVAAALVRDGRGAELEERLRRQLLGVTE